MKTDSLVHPGSLAPGADPTTLSILVPCYNEEANLTELVERLERTYREMGVRGETILVDDASTDGTWATIEALAARDPTVRPVRHDRNQGMFAAWRSGLAVAAGPYVGVIDADLQYQPEDISRLWEHFHRTHCDVAQGARVNVTGERGLRFWLSRGLNALLNLTFRMSLHDNKSGFFITRRELAAEILGEDSGLYYPQTFVMVAAHARGYSIGEVRCFFASREQGESFIPRFPAWIVVGCLIDTIRYALRSPAKAPVRQLEETIRRAAATPAATERPEVAARPVAEPTEISRRKLRRHLRLMPVHHWTITRDAGTYFSQLEASQWLSADAIRELQREKLIAMLHHAYNHVSFYRRRMEAAGIVPNDVGGIEDLALLPPLTKEEIRRNLYFDLLADNARVDDLQRVRTSGSTGTPLSIYVDRFQLEMRWASTLRAQEWTGYRFGDRTVRLWHQTVSMTPKQVIKERLDAWSSRRLFIPAFAMTLDNLGDSIERLIRHRPTLIDGYAESLHLMARYLNERTIDCPPLKGVMSSAQTLPAASRERIERAFGCRVFDKYGAREFSGIAYECDHHRGHHLVAESYIVEIVKDGRPARPGEIGEVLITDLNNRCMPLLRYRIGDLAVPADDPNCSCGRGLPLIGEIMGRTQAIIIGTGGRFLPGAFFDHLIKDYDASIRQFQVVQDRLGAIELRIVKGGRYSPSSLDRLLDQFHSFLGDDMTIDVVFQTELEMVPTGKVRHSISNLEFDFQTLQAVELESSQD